MKVLHIISGLDVGGAEMMLYKLISTAKEKDIFESEVISLTNVGSVGKKIKFLGIKVKSLNMKRGNPNPFFIFKLAYLMRLSKPDIIQTWMYHADLMGGISSKLIGRIPVIWNIRNSDLDKKKSKRTTRWTAKFCAETSKWLPKKIVCCSEVSKVIHINIGYASNKMIVIPNGFDLSKFKPSLENRLSVFRELNLPDDAILVGLIARFDPQKDHLNFIKAAKILFSHFPYVHFLLCGREVNWSNKTLNEWIGKSNIRNHFHLLGQREDISRIISALDIATTSSAYGEAFPNIIGEAMACGVPCVATDVGDSSLIIGNTGKIIPPKDSEALANAWSNLIKIGHDGRKQLGMAARQRVKTNFDLLDIVGKYRDLYEEVIRENRKFESTS